ncbi:MAG: sulfatase-like hydrolase/transferase [Verrucomicrobiales bacterium]|nr:sulfatase-like hydrolase/transferase [Verrucomicrobiales bacterium]
MKKRLTILIVVLSSALVAKSADRPNILWISSEDNGPHLGCYGDEYAITPHLDALAKKSLRYTRASSTAPVCAPARTTIISGIYPPATGGEHMRSFVPLPEQSKMFPAYLAGAGYHCTNPGKKDYNLAEPAGTWVNVPKGKGRRTWQARDEGQPFFAVYNFTISHESKIRNNIEPENAIHDPAKARVPAYHPDTPEVRKDWAQYYDRITMMDKECGQALADLEKDGLAEDTIVFYWGDHGSGMPRNKRWPYNSGLHVPLLVHFPEKWAHLAPEEYKSGGTSDRLVGFVDLAPTMLSICGIEPKDWMQGHAFAGKYETEPQKFSYGFRGRMDERVDLVRTVMDQRYVYIRQYMPHRIYGQYIQYMFQTPTTRVWHDMFHAGKLNKAQSHFWQEKPAEELYDLQTDPDEVNNLAGSSEHAEILDRMRKAHKDWAKKIRDIGFLPEAEIHSRSVGTTPYEMGHDPSQYDFDTIFAAADLASNRNSEDIPAIVKLLSSEDSAVRYWGAQGLLIHKEAGVKAGHAELVAALKGSSSSVAVIAAEALGRFGPEQDLPAALDTLIKYANQNESNVFDAILAANALDYLDEKAVSRLDDIKALPTKQKVKTERTNNYVGSLLPKVISDIQ